MRYNFIEYNQDQQHLLPKDLSEWVEEDGLERFISDTIDFLDREGSSGWEIQLDRHRQTQRIAVLSSIFNRADKTTSQPESVRRFYIFYRLYQKYGSLGFVM